MADDNDDDGVMDCGWLCVPYTYTRTYIYTHTYIRGKERDSVREREWEREREWVSARVVCIWEMSIWLVWGDDKGQDPYGVIFVDLTSSALGVSDAVLRWEDASDV